MNGELYFFCIVFGITGVLVGLSLYSACRKGSKKKSEYMKNRKAKKSLIIRERYIMKELTTGAIKCGVLKNKSEKYNVEKWVKGMHEFLDTPEYKRLMELEGNEAYEKH